MHSLQTKNQSIIALKSLFFVANLCAAGFAFASEKPSTANIKPLSKKAKINLDYDDPESRDGTVYNAKILEEQPKGTRYGICHNYAISKALGLKGQIPTTLPIVGGNDWHEVLKFTEKYCKEVSVPQKDDLVTYHENSNSSNITHMGLVYDDGIVESKWGFNPQIVVHPTHDVPATYGNHVKYHRVIQPTNEIIEDIQKTILHFDYDAACTQYNKNLINYAEQSNNLEAWYTLQGCMCANVEATNDKGQSLLMIGAKKNNLFLVETALQYGANINKQDKKGKTALDLARKNNAKIIKILTQETSA